MTATRQIVTFSDRHIGAKYSTFHENMSQVASLLQELEVKVATGAIKEAICVINGDDPELCEPGVRLGQEDFAGARRRVERSYQDYLGYLIETYPHVKFVLIVGNHERGYTDPVLSPLLRQYGAAADEGNLFVTDGPEARLTVLDHEKAYIMLGDFLIFHGDGAVGGVQAHEQPTEPKLGSDLWHPIEGGMVHAVKMKLKEAIAGQVSEDVFVLEGAATPTALTKSLNLAPVQVIDAVSRAIANEESVLAREAGDACLKITGVQMMIFGHIHPANARPEGYRINSAMLSHNFTRFDAPTPTAFVSGAAVNGCHFDATLITQEPGLGVRYLGGVPTYRTTEVERLGERELYHFEQNHPLPDTVIAALRGFTKDMAHARQ